MTATDRSEFDGDVVVVGAGLAGLTATRQLSKADRAVLVLEADDRVGGRTLSPQLSDGSTVDLGAQWIASDQDRMRNLVSEFGIDTFSQHTDGRDQLRTRDDTLVDNDLYDALPLSARLNLAVALWRLNTLCERVPLDAPYEAPKAATWDGMTVETWKRRALRTREARAAFDAYFRAEFTTDPADLSFLYFLFCLRSSGGFEGAVAGGDSGQETRLVGGTQQVSQEMADELAGAVRLSSPVRAIEQHGEGVTVRFDSGTATGRYAIVAVPPAMTGRIEYDPPLPARRDGLAQRVPMGSVIKCVATYERPFWRQRGYSGLVAAEGSTVDQVFDGSPVQGETGALVGFLVGDHAREWSDEPEEVRREEVLGQFVEFFGPDAAEPLEYVDRTWSNDPWIRGGYAGNMAPGTMTGYGKAIREPVGRVHWAGTETATEWYGYMEGAVRSGERAAREVLSRLGNTDRSKRNTTGSTYRQLSR